MQKGGGVFYKLYSLNISNKIKPKFIKYLAI